MSKKKSTPAQNEAESIETVTVEWRGLTLTIPASLDDWPAAAIVAMYENYPTPAVCRALGPEQTEAVFALNPTDGEIKRELFDLIAQAMGFTSSGESSAS